MRHRGRRGPGPGGCVRRRRPGRQPAAGARAASARRRAAGRGRPRQRAALSGLARRGRHAARGRRRRCGPPAVPGSCKSCPSSSVTLELAVEDAVRAAAPEIASIEVVAARSGHRVAAVIPADSLLQPRPRTTDSGAAPGIRFPSSPTSRPGEVGGFRVAGTTVLACRVGDDLFAYRDRCGSCDGSLAGAALHRPMGSAVGEAVLRCPQCRAHFDVVHAGAGVDGDDERPASRADTAAGPRRRAVDRDRRRATVA